MGPHNVFCVANIMRFETRLSYVTPNGLQNGRVGRWETGVLGCQLRIYFLKKGVDKNCPRNRTATVVFTVKNRIFRTAIH